MTPFELGAKAGLKKKPKSKRFVLGVPPSPAPAGPRGDPQIDYSAKGVEGIHSAPNADLNSEMPQRGTNQIKTASWLMGVEEMRRLAEKNAVSRQSIPDRSGIPKGGRVGSLDPWDDKKLFKQYGEADSMIDPGAPISVEQPGGQGTGDMNVSPDKLAALDPATLVGLAAGAKITAANVLSRHGHKIPGAKWLGKEIAGVGVRTGAKGYPGLSRATREGLAALGSPGAVGIYEQAHAAGKQMGPEGIAKAKAMLKDPRLSGVTKSMPDALKTKAFIESIPTEATGARKYVDYLFKPVGEVRKDIAGALRRKNVEKVAFKNQGERQRDHQAYMRNRFRRIQASRIYRAQNKAKIKRYQKKYNRQVKMKARRPKQRVGTGAGGYTFLMR